MTTLPALTPWQASHSLRASGSPLFLLPVGVHPPDSGKAIAREEPDTLPTSKLGHTAHPIKVVWAAPKGAKEGPYFGGILLQSGLKPQCNSEWGPSGH